MSPGRLLHALLALQAFLTANDVSLVNHTAHYRFEGKRIATAVVESMVNRVSGRRMAKQQPMRWRRHGAHLLVQIRVAVLDGHLPHLFQGWYPRFEPAGTRRPLTTPRFLPVS
jgi:hypothetical protein